MEQWEIRAQEVGQVFRHPDSIGISYQSGREMRSAELGGRLITLVVDTSDTIATVWTVWADLAGGEALA